MGCNPSSLGNFTGGQWFDFDFFIDKNVLAPVQLIRSVPSLLSSDRERYEMASRSNSIGYENKTRKIVTEFQGPFASF